MEAVSAEEATWEMEEEMKKASLQGKKLLALVIPKSFSVFIKLAKIVKKIY